MLNTFRENLRELYEKSQMNVPYEQWPFTYDAVEGNENEGGIIHINQEGTLFFADTKTMNWVESPLHLSNISSYRYFRFWADGDFEHDDEEPEISYIRIYFCDGSRIELENYHVTYRADVKVSLACGTDNEEALALLKEKCERPTLKFDTR